MRPIRFLIALSLIAIATPVLAQAPATAQATPETRRVRLEADTVIDGIHCAPTGRAYAEFFINGGRLAECPLAEAANVGGHDLPAGTWVILHPDGRLRLVWLSRNARFGDVVCKGTGYKEWVTTFHPNGAVETCFLPRAATIDGIPCRAGTFLGELTGGVAVRFHANGRLESCSLGQPVTVGGERYRAWRRIWLDADGRPVASRS